MLFLSTAIASRMIFQSIADRDVIEGHLGMPAEDSDVKESNLKTPLALAMGVCQWYDVIKASAWVEKFLFLQFATILACLSPSFLYPKENKVFVLLSLVR